MIFAHAPSNDVFSSSEASAPRGDHSSLYESIEMLVLVNGKSPSQSCSRYSTMIDPNVYATTVEQKVVRQAVQYRDRR
jgi:hypothetical protein